MKKLLVMCAALFMMTATGFAQDAVPAKKVKEKGDLNTMLKPLTDKLDAVPEAEQNEETIKKYALEFVKENENEAGVYVLTRMLAHLMPIGDVIQLVEGNAYFKKDASIQQQMANWKVQLETSEGRMFKDFSAKYEGKVTNLSDYVGKGKYVLVDFWSTGCRPCWDIMPKLIDIYNTYHGESFDMLSVAVIEPPEVTKQSASQMGIVWNQIINARLTPSKVYGFDYMPCFFLFGPDGTILKREIPERKLEKTVKKALGV